MKVNKALIGIAGIAFGLAACSSGGGDSGGGDDKLLTPEEAALQVFATPEGGEPFANLLEALKVGKVYARRVTSAGVIENPEAEGATNFYELDNTDFDVEVTDGVRAITFMIDGVEYALDESNESTIEGCEGNCDIWRDDTGIRFVQIFPFGVDGIENGVFDPESVSYRQSFSYFADATTGDNEARSGYAVVGAETRESELDSLVNPAATFDGFAFFDIRQQGLNDDDFKAGVRAKLTLTANFADDIIGGVGENLAITLNDGSFTSDGSVVVFETTAIQGNAFLGDLSPNEDFLADENLELFSSVIGASEYSGAFFGPTGEQIGGVASGSATLGEDKYIMYGIFEAE